MTNLLQIDANTVLCEYGTAFHISGWNKYFTKEDNLRRAWGVTISALLTKRAVVQRNIAFLNQ